MREPIGLPPQEGQSLILEGQQACSILPAASLSHLMAMADLSLGDPVRRSHDLNPINLRVGTNAEGEPVTAQLQVSVPLGRWTGCPFGYVDWVHLCWPGGPCAPLVFVFSPLQRSSTTEPLPPGLVPLYLQGVVTAAPWSSCQPASCWMAACTAATARS